jgi:hypothetical protein
VFTAVETDGRVSCLSFISCPQSQFTGYFSAFIQSNVFRMEPYFTDISTRNLSAGTLAASDMIYSVGTLLFCFTELLVYRMSVSTITFLIKIVINFACYTHTHTHRCVCVCVWFFFLVTLSIFTPSLFLLLLSVTLPSFLSFTHTQTHTISCSVPGHLLNCQYFGFKP